MFLIVSRLLIPKGFRGITLYPFIIIGTDTDRNNKLLVDHERIHIRQQGELLVVFFFIWYGIEFLLRLIRYRDRNKAYRNISFEREAYSNEKDPGYLKSRPLWCFINYL
ncbi:MAG TPA: hypothetical protein VGB50_03805 [Flavobacterium sp.]|jgi:hypothetical protein